MRIVYILDTLARIGGLERIITDKMNWLAENGHEVTLITAAQGDHPHSFPLSEKVRHTDINARFHVQYRYRYPMRLFVRWQMDRRFLRNLSRAIESIAPDVIVATTYYKADVVSGMRCRAVKIIESHNARPFTGRMDGVRRNAIIQWFHDISLRRYNSKIERKADAIVTLTEGDAREWAAARRVCVIPNIYTNPSTVSVNTSENSVPPANANQTNAADNEHQCHRRVIAAGRLVYQKGFDMLLEAWSMIEKQCPEWRRAIYGMGDRTPYEQQAARLGLDMTRCHINGSTADIEKEYSESSLFVLSSRFEGFGMVLVEAMSCGLPVVSFACPCGPRDIVSNGQNGLLVENGNVGQLAKAMLCLISDDDMRRKMGESAKDDAQRFDLDVIAGQWQKLFETTMNSNHHH